jgi:uncharacterized membrane protein
MNRLRALFQTTLIGGALFLIPLVFVVMILGKAFQIMKVIAKPIGRLIPVDSVAGVALVEVLTVFIMILSCLLAGMLARSPWGQRVNQKLDALLLQMIPGYAWVKGMTGEIQDEEADAVLKPVLVRLDDQFQLALEVDRDADGLVAVYLPGAPDPRSGVVSYVMADRIQPVNAGFKTVVKICKNLGRDSTAILSGREAV